MQLDSGLAAIRAARHFVASEVVAHGGEQVVDDATLVAAELLANAVLHGSPPVSVDVSGDESRIRLTVSDASGRAPVRPAASASNMTGRGLALVEAIATRWGVTPTGDGGKTVWAEFEAADSAQADSDINVDDILAAWEEPSDHTSAPRYTVVLGDVPTDLLIEAKAHIDNLVREFTLLASGSAGGRLEPESDLAALVQTVVYQFADARDAIKRQALAAAQQGEPRTKLSLHLPASAADAGEAYLSALDEADAYARAARLLTLETPPAHRLFRHWYVESIVRQLRDLATGKTPDPVVPFESRMVEEIQRLATLQRVTDQAARLQRVTAALANARTPEDVADVVVSEGVAALEAYGGGLLVPAEDGEHLAVPGVVGYKTELVDALREERLDAPLPAATVLRTGEPVWLESQDERDRRFPALRGFEAATVSMCSVPLTVAGRILGALRFSFATRRLFDDDERAFVLALAAQTAQTLVRTESYAAERKASLDLQRALLPEDTPAIPGWDIAAYYSPAGQQQAGGDFYDVLSLGDGRVVAVVGDVMGRGVQAAAAMAQIRTMIRAYAVHDPTPDVVFSKVDTFFRIIDRTEFATALYFLIDANSGSVTVGNAGHLPPIIVSAEGTRLADIPSGTPIGVGGFERTTTTMAIAPDSAIVVITDGLVERRGEDIDAGINRILAATANGPHDVAASTLLRRVVAAARATGVQDDDVTVLVLHRTGAATSSDEGLD
jgi:serine phosphatase RsbU (regulator of sigma subunit)/anti-sigma regulatory factor (Ser/Thr protein kinase)